MGRFVAAASVRGVVRATTPGPATRRLAESVVGVIYLAGATTSGAAGLASERVERRLTAILAADVAGYSRLMEADEEETLARLKAHRRELFDPKIA